MTASRVNRTFFLALIICAIAVSALAEPLVRNVVTIPVKLQKDYLPSTLPTAPVDDGLRVCLVLPTFDAAMSASWPTAVKWGGGLTPKEENITEVDRIVVDFAGATAAALPGIVKRLFPKAEVKRPQVPPQCDLLLEISLRSSAFDDASGHLGGVTVIANVNAIAGDGTAISTIVASATGNVTKSIYWSSNTRVQSIGEPALKGMLDHLVRKLMFDPSLAAYIKTRAAERARPSDLQTIARFDDSASFFPNSHLDAGEMAKLLFTVKNRGAGPAFGVRLRLSSTAKGISVPVETEIGDMAAGASKDIAVAIAGGLDVESALQTLHVETLEKRGYGGRPLDVELATSQLKKPGIEIADIALNSGGNRGDANGRPSNGGAAVVTVLVRNTGPGDAVGVHLTLESRPDVEIVDRKVDLQAIPVNAVREARFTVRLPTTFAATDLPLTVRAEELRGAQVAQTSRMATWPVELRRPAIDLAYRLFDGNSPESRGNRDGVANNGETLELALTPINRGALAARDVSIIITSRQPGVTVTPEKFQAGELPPLAEGAEHRVRLVVPRTLGRDLPLEKLPLVASIAQRDFALAEQPIMLPFKARRPDLAAEITSVSPLVEGNPAAFALELRNRGTLTAENVRVEVSCDNIGLELFDESGVPTRKVVVDVGTIAAQAAPWKLDIKAQVRRNLPKTSTSLAVVVQQADFPSVTTQAALKIQREQVTVISTIPADVAPRAAPAERAPLVPAAISFQRYENGDPVNEETIALRFEIQSLTPLKTVRLEQNHRPIDLGTARGPRDENVHAVQYEPQVRLDFGENLFEVVVVTTAGAATKRSIIINRERPQGKVWVAAVGISKYANKGVADLAFARDDAAAFIDYYRQFGVPEGQLIALFDEQATLSAIKRNLGTDLVNKATNPDDTVILYFAGHGQKESDRASVDADGYTKYLLPYDANPSDLFGSALSMEELSRILQRLRPDRVVLIIDSCFSGAAGGRTLSNADIVTRAPITDEFLARMAAAGKGRVILTASSGHEVAQESNTLRHGVFTYYLLQALSGEADADGDGRVDIDEIYKFVAQKVAAATNGRQTPMKKAPSLTGTVILGRRMRSQ